LSFTISRSLEALANEEAVAVVQPAEFFLRASASSFILVYGVYQIGEVVLAWR